MKMMNPWVEERDRRLKRLFTSTNGRRGNSPFRLHRESPADDQRLRFFLNREAHEIGTPVRLTRERESRWEAWVKSFKTLWHHPHQGKESIL